MEDLTDKDEGWTVDGKGDQLHLALVKGPRLISLCTFGHPRSERYARTAIEKAARLWNMSYQAVREALMERHFGNRCPDCQSAISDYQLLREEFHHSSLWFRLLN
jgi:hypothetical protein